MSQNPDYAYKNYVYRKGPGPTNLSGLDENPDYTCPDEAKLPVLSIICLTHLRNIKFDFHSRNNACSNVSGNDISGYSYRFRAPLNFITTVRYLSIPPLY